MDGRSAWHTGTACNCSLCNFRWSKAVSRPQGESFLFGPPPQGMGEKQKSTLDESALKRHSKRRSDQRRNRLFENSNFIEMTAAPSFSQSHSQRGVKTQRYPKRNASMRRGSDESVSAAYAPPGVAGQPGQLKYHQEAPSTTSASCEVIELNLLTFLTQLGGKIQNLRKSSSQLVKRPKPIRSPSTQ